MSEIKAEWAVYRLPDGTLSSHDEENAAAELVATEMLAASAKKAAELFTAAQLAGRQKGIAEDLAERFREIALASMKSAEKAAESALQKVTQQQAIAAEKNASAEKTAAEKLFAAQVAAETAANAFEAQLSNVTDIAILRKLATQELAKAREIAAVTLVDARMAAENRISKPPKWRPLKCCRPQQLAECARQLNLSRHKLRRCKNLSVLKKKLRRNSPPHKPLQQTSWSPLRESQLSTSSFPKEQRGKNSSSRSSSFDK
jgi:hypothetical protein